METNQHGHLVLECMQRLDMEVGDRVSVDDLAECAFAQGVELDELENAIIHASRPVMARKPRKQTAMMANERAMLPCRTPTNHSSTFSTGAAD